MEKLNSIDPTRLIACLIIDLDHGSDERSKDKLQSRSIFLFWFVSDQCDFWQRLSLYFSWFILSETGWIIWNTHVGLLLWYRSGRNSVLYIPSIDSVREAVHIYVTLTYQRTRWRATGDNLRRASDRGGWERTKAVEVTLNACHLHLCFFHSMDLYVAFFSLIFWYFTILYINRNANVCKYFFSWV